MVHRNSSQNLNSGRAKLQNQARLGSRHAKRVVDPRNQLNFAGPQRAPPPPPPSQRIPPTLASVRRPPSGRPTPKHGDSRKRASPSRTRLSPNSSPRGKESSRPRRPPPPPTLRSRCCGGGRRPRRGRWPAGASRP
jgi:hypothetical protein